MSRPHTERIVGELSTDARGILQRFRDEELSAGNFLHDRVVWVVDDFLEPRVERLVGDMVNAVIDRYGSLSLNDFLGMINDLRTERTADA